MNGNSLTKLLIAVSSLSLIQCSGVNFGAANGSVSSSSQAPTEDGSTLPPKSPAGGNVTSPGGETPPASGSVGTTTPIVYPKAYATAPECVRDFKFPKTPCEITFHLYEAMSYDTEFDWLTNDASPRPAASRPQYIVGLPNYHYIPNSGRVRIPAGATEFKVYVDNISPVNVNLEIPFLMVNCRYDNKAIPGDCEQMFAAP